MTVDLLATGKEADVRRAVEVAYRLGAEDARRLCVAAVLRLWRIETGAASAALDRALEKIERIDPTRAQPDWTGMVRAALGGHDA